MELIFNHRRPTWDDLLTNPSQNNNIIVDDTEPIAQLITQSEDEIDKQQKELINMSKEDTRTQKKQKKEIKNMYKEDKFLIEKRKKEQLKKFQDILLKIKSIDKKNFTRGNINNYFKKIININQEIDDIDEIVVNNKFIIKLFDNLVIKSDMIVKFQFSRKIDDDYEIFITDSKYPPPEIGDKKISNLDIDKDLDQSLIIYYIIGISDYLLEKFNLDEDLHNIFQNINIYSEDEQYNKYNNYFEKLLPITTNTYKIFFTSGGVQPSGF
jgi:hypothetical protein